MPNIAQLKYFSLGGFTVVVSADLPIQDSTFRSNIRRFESETPEKEKIFLHHQFSFLALPFNTMSFKVYHNPPWEIYQEEAHFRYVHFYHEAGKYTTIFTASFTDDHSQGTIYHNSPDTFLLGDHHSLSLFPTDQILISRVLANRKGCIFHAGGMILNNQGILFAGHSGAGKSTMMRLLRNSGEILCDDRNIVRRNVDGWRLYGTWSHGDIPDVSPNSAPLRAIILLEQAPETKLIPINDRREIVRQLPLFIVKPLVTAEWWEKTLDLVGQISREVPVYRLRFEKSERVIEDLKPLLG